MVNAEISYDEIEKLVNKAKNNKAVKFLKIMM